MLDFTKNICTFIIATGQTPNFICSKLVNRSTKIQKELLFIQTEVKLQTSHSHQLSSVTLKILLYFLTCFSISGPALRPSKWANMYCLALRKKF